MDWQCIDEKVGLWTAEYRVPGFLCRSTALRLADGEFLVFSPGQGQAADFAKVHGKATHLLTPNSVHHMGLSEWRIQFPDVKVHAHPGGHNRLAKKGHRSLLGLDELRTALPTHCTIMEPPHNRIGEVWLRIQGSDGVIWCVGDSFFNMPKLARRFIPRLTQRLLRAAPGVSHSNLMKWGGLSSRRGFKKWALERIAEDQPQTIVVLHGDLISENASEQLTELIERRL
jgi:hypothetical protein